MTEGFFNPSKIYTSIGLKKARAAPHGAPKGLREQSLYSCKMHECNHGSPLYVINMSFILYEETVFLWLRVSVLEIFTDFQTICSLIDCQRSIVFADIGKNY